jgi:hypothetical protein
LSAKKVLPGIINNLTFPVVKLEMNPEIMYPEILRGYPESLLQAAEEGYPEIIYTVLDQGVDFEIEMAILMAAATNGHLLMVQALLDRIAGDRTSQYNDILVNAACSGQMSIIRFILNSRVDISADLEKTFE